MRKFSLFLLVGFLANFILSQVPYANNTNLIFTFVGHFLEGMAKNQSECNCPKVWNKYENDIKIILWNVLEDYEKNVAIETIVRKYAIKFITIRRLAESCNLLNFIPIYKKITSDNFLEAFNNYFTNNTDKIYYKLKNSTDNNSRYKAFGEIVSIFLDFQVN